MKIALEESEADGDGLSHEQEDRWAVSIPALGTRSSSHSTHRLLK